MQKLPDKGAKIQATVTKLEAEVERRRKEAAIKKAQMTRTEIEELEWALGSISFLRPQSNSDSSKKSKEPLDSDDDEDEVEGKPPDPLKIIATSQITQRQPKSVVDTSCEEVGPTVKMDASDNDKSEDLDRFTTRIVKTELKKPKEDKKFVPNKTVKMKAAGSASPAGSTTSTSSNSSKKGERHKNWDESLLPPALSAEPAKLLSMEETIKIGSEKCKQFEVS